MRGWLVRTTMVAVCVLVFGAGAPAQEWEGAPLEGDADGVRLSLQDSLATALERNLDLVAARFDPQVSEENIAVRRGEFDPTVAVFAQQDSSRFDPTEPFAIPREVVTAGSRATYPLPTGGTVVGEVIFSNQTRGTVVDPDNVDTTRLNLELDIPLLRGFGSEVTKELLLLARADLEISREELRRQAELVLQNTENAYWDVAAARANLGVQNLALERANDLLELNRKKVEVGTLPPIEITQAEAGVASNREGVIVAETRLFDAEDTLREFMAIPDGDPLWNRRLITTDEPAAHSRSIDLQDAIDTALENRPEIISQEMSLKNDELRERVARNRSRHGLDLSVAFRPYGDSISAGMPGGFEDSLDELAEIANQSRSVGLTYSIPIGNRTAKANYRIATLNREKSEMALAGQEQTIRVAVRKAVRGVESGFERVEAARSNVRLQREKLDAEERKFENGMSTSFEVLTFQNDLADAELALINALLDYQKALVALEQAKGTLLPSHSLSVDLAGSAGIPDTE